jgi:hypothetical protein
MMNIQARNQYMETLRERYLKANKKEKGRILDEYCRNTGQDRKYAIKKFRYKVRLKRPEERKRRKEYYDGYVRAALVRCWEIFDYPCGQRLEPLLKSEVERLRKQGELICSDEVAAKLKKISFRTIDEKLKHQKEVLRLKRKYHNKTNPLLYQKIPVKTMAEQNRETLGNIQIDLVEHCGESAAGEFINTLSTTDISSGWWEGEAVLSRGQEALFKGLQQIKSQYPFSWKEIHSDNGTEFINWHLYRYSQKENLDFSRLRPYKKNDNCLVEQKNATHIKRFVGYLRYDTLKELAILNDLYRNELRLYKNFFQPVIKLKEKIRVKGKIHRRYEKARTPYQYLMESREISLQTKQELRNIYDNLNPAELKRTIDKKLHLLYEAYKTKKGRDMVEPAAKKLKPISVSFLANQHKPISVS